MKAAANDAEPKPERRRSSSPLRRDVQMYDRLQEAEAEVANLQEEAADLWCKLEASEARVKALEANGISLKGNNNWLKERLAKAESDRDRMGFVSSDLRQRISRLAEVEHELVVKTGVCGKAVQDSLAAERQLKQLRPVLEGWAEDFYRIRTRLQLLQRGFRGWVLWLCRVDLSEIEALAMERRLPD